VGLIELEDTETGEQILVDTSDSSFRTRYAAIVREAEEEIRSRFSRHNVPYITIRTDEEYQVPLGRFFAHRHATGMI